MDDTLSTGIQISRPRALAAMAALAAAALVPRIARAASATTLAPIFAADDPWLNGRATAGTVAGKVVVVDVFTVDCFNCRNVTPTLRDLSRRPGVAVIGIHTPETSYERDRSHIVAKLAELGITWPVVLDNDQRLWDAYGIDAWPTQLFFGHDGDLRHTVVGDSQDAEVLATVQKLIA